jgi:hypothetical protein
MRMTESCIATCSRRPLPLRARSNNALTMLKVAERGRDLRNYYRIRGAR